MNIQPKFVEVDLKDVMNLPKMFCCRLCLRIQPQSQFREIQVEVELHLKIFQALEVDIQEQDHTTVVCFNCLRLVDIVYRFRMACRRANDILAKKVLQIMPRGSWEDDDTCQALVDCQYIVKDHYSEMEKLYNRCGLENSENFEMEYELTSDEEDEDEEDEDEDEELEDEAEEQEGEKDMDEGDEAMGEYEEDEMIIKDESLSIPYIDSADDENYFDKQRIFPESSDSESKRLKSSHYFCDECGTMVPNTMIEYHQNKHLGVRPYTCPQLNCGVSFYSLKTCQVHEKQVHNTPLMECEICNTLLKGIHAYRRHMHSHEENDPRKVPCPICKKLFYK